MTTSYLICLNISGQSTPKIIGQLKSCLFFFLIFCIEAPKNNYAVRWYWIYSFHVTIMLWFNLVLSYSHGRLSTWYLNFEVLDQGFVLLLQYCAAPLEILSIFKKIFLDSTWIGPLLHPRECWRNYIDVQFSTFWS